MPRHCCWSLEIQGIYILGNKCIVRTDHTPIVGLLGKRDLTRRVTCWQCLLEEYRLRIETRAGRQHSNVDGMSRMRSEEVVPKTNEDVDDNKFEYRA